MDTLSTIQTGRSIMHFDASSFKIPYSEIEQLIALAMLLPKQ